MRRHYKTDNSPRVAQILKQGDEEWYTLITPYDKEFLVYFKGVISWKRRKWDAERKLWTFAPEYLLQVYYYCKSSFDDVIGDAHVKSQLKEKLELKNGTNPYNTLFLTKEAPDWIVEKMFKILMFDDRSDYRHPDKGGDPAKAAELNMAMDKIKRRETT